MNAKKHNASIAGLFRSGLPLASIGCDVERPAPRQPFRLWQNCPNCDAELSIGIAPGDDWQCESCGEYGTRSDS
jgi:hypothetical protein